MSIKIIKDILSQTSTILFIWIMENYNLHNFVTSSISDAFKIKIYFKERNIYIVSQLMFTRNILNYLIWTCQFSFMSKRFVRFTYKKSCKWIAEGKFYQSSEQKTHAGCHPNIYCLYVGHLKFLDTRTQDIHFQCILAELL